ncbi:MAG: rubrerythrin [Herbinix sp.]|jgi:rubrerythrin|nr:rubrerythrin [Herbinix sp.]
MNTIDFAINMELEGQKYYLDLAELNMDNELNNVFLLLADSEGQHAALLEKFKKKEILNLNEQFIQPEFKSVFQNLKYFHKEHSAKQLEAYRIACEQEEKSIELYKSMKANVQDGLNEEIFDYLIGQEQDHLILFEELVKMVTRPEEWVESAEFGIREDY